MCVLIENLSLLEEELCNGKGMELFVGMDYFKKLNVGFALDEGKYDSYNLYSVSHCKYKLY